MESLRPRLEEHLDKIALSSRDSSLDHWKGEAWAWLHKIEALVLHAGKKTSAEWQAQIDIWRIALEGEPEDAE